ncbi:MAG: ArnT family glycosyltransferase, partial [Isosphaeraceae bacterium]
MPELPTDPGSPSVAFWTRPRLALAVTALLTLHLSLAVRSLVLENPTIDEVLHLPAAITYWQKGTFRLYHHNPPLFKLVAALPAMAMGPRLPYHMPSWTVEPPNKSAFGHEFLQLNAPIYFELFTRSRLVMPIFSLIGGLVVFSWSRRLYGAGAGLLSLTLWTLCPNILAHARLLTSDVAAASIGVLATFTFWRFLKNPTWKLAALSGIALGVAQLTKFSLVVLYGFWPFLALARTVTDQAWRLAVARTLAQAVLVVGLSLFVIGLGYGFEGVGTPLGDFEFVCQTLTRPVPPGTPRPASPDALLNGAYRYRVNRFRGTFLESVPSPLPSHYLLGFDEQKLEAEGVPLKFMDPTVTGPRGDEPQGYPVYLDGALSQKSWWYYYVLTLIYKVPEGTWLIVLGSFGVLAFSKRSRADGFDEFAVLTVPAVVLLVMSVFTNIAIGLRYVLPVFPYLFISAGKLIPWASGFRSKATRAAAWSLIGLGLIATSSATLTIHPHYLAYFNWASGGPDQGAEHLIDSNLDWGQDLIGLRRWLERNAPGEPVGLA